MISLYSVGNSLRRRLDIVVSCHRSFGVKRLQSLHPLSFLSCLVCTHCTKTDEVRKSLDHIVHYSFGRQQILSTGTDNTEAHVIVVTKANQMPHLYQPITFCFSSKILS
jgi:5-methylcytosine-specific restriction endonuclease McrA